MVTSGNEERDDKKAIDQRSAFLKALGGKSPKSPPMNRQHTSQPVGRSQESVTGSKRVKAGLDGGTNQSDGHKR